MKEILVEYRSLATISPIGALWAKIGLRQRSPLFVFLVNSDHHQVLLIGGCIGAVGDGLSTVFVDCICVVWVSRHDDHSVAEFI